MTDAPLPDAWLLLTFGEDRQYAGNRGYDDDVRAVYRYDSFVPNHKQIAEGDLAVLRDKTGLLGVARIEAIDRHSGTKTRNRCPECGKTTLKQRTSTTLRYRCHSCSAEFDEPKEDTVTCERFDAWFGTSFVEATSAVPVPMLRAACAAYNGQLAMQRINLARILPTLRRANAAIDNLLSRGIPPPLLAPDAADEDEEAAPGYEPGREDAREEVKRAIKRRRGQRVFRDQLRNRFEDTCAVTGCRVLDVLEAAHIAPYRGARDNHAANGLLLRADIHTLFDLDLLGIDPDTLEVKLDPRIRFAPYDELEGRRLLLKGQWEPSKAALRLRWAVFRKGGSSS